MRTLKYQGIRWHDDPSPSEKDILAMQEEFGFHELDIEDCLSEHERPKIEEYDTYLFLVFHIPYRTKSGRVAKEEINIFLGQDFIITLHEGKIALLDSLWKKLDGNDDISEEYLHHGTGFFLYKLMNLFFDEIFPLVDSITKDIRRMEEDLFESEEQMDLLRDIMNVKRNIISMRSILLPQRTLIATLEHKNKKFVPEELGLYFDDILDAIERQWSLLETAKEMADALQDTHESWMSHKTNAIVRVLTIFSVTMLPLTFITGLFGMNVQLPLAHHANAFFWLISIMTILLFGMIGYFTRKHWL